MFREEAEQRRGGIPAPCPLGLVSRGLENPRSVVALLRRPARFGIVAHFMDFAATGFFLASCLPGCRLIWNPVDFVVAHILETRHYKIRSGAIM